jgi:DNA polymerase-3 subunit gamma/tau
VKKLSETPVPPPAPGGGGAPAPGGGTGATARGAMAGRAGSSGAVTALAVQPENALARYARFEQVVELIRAHREVQLLIEVEKYVRLARYEPGRIEFEPGPGAPGGLAQKLGQRLQLWTGVRWAVTLVNEGGQPTIAEVRDAERDALRAEALEHPLVKAVLAAFPEATITDIREPETLEAEAAEAALPEVEDEWDPFEED